MSSTHSNISRRQMLLATASAALTWPASVLAQSAYPHKPVELIVPFPPGGGTDALARTLSEAMRRHLPQSLVIVNKAGASGGVGWAELVSARPDGKVRPLVVMGQERIGSGWDNVPTAKERGFDVMVTGWRGLAAPKGTPPEVLQVLRQAVAKAMQEPALKETMHKLNLREGYLDAPEFAAVMTQDNATYRALINKLNLKV